MGHQDEHNLSRVACQEKGTIATLAKSVGFPRLPPTLSANVATRNSRMRFGLVEEIRPREHVGE